MKEYKKPLIKVSHLHANPVMAAGSPTDPVDTVPEEGEETLSKGNNFSDIDNSMPSRKSLWDD